MRRSLGSALWVVAGLLASFLGGLGALAGTASGRTLVTAAATAALGTLVDGSIEIASVSGPLVTGVTVQGLRVFDRERHLVATLPTVTASYDPFDFIAGRFVLLALRLEHPVLDLVQHRDGGLNLAEVLRLRGSPGSVPGPGPLILFRNVDVDDGTVSLRTWEAAAGVESEEGVGLHAFEHIDARLPVVRLSGPAGPGVRIDVVRLAMVSSDPRLDVRDAVGRLRVAGDSVVVDLSTLALPRSELAARGVVLLGGRGPLMDLRVELDSLRLGDAGFLLSRLPASTVCRGTATVRSRGPRALEVRLDPIRVRYGGGTLAGRLGFLTTSDSGLVALSGVDVVADDLDLDLPRALLDTLPFAGRLSGRTIATGRLKDLAVALDWQFRDSLAAGAPSSVQGQGHIGAGTGDGLRFTAFDVQGASVSLETVRRLVPSVVPLRGDLRLAGVLNGPLHDVQFTGSVVHEDGSRPVSTVEGTVTLDTRTDFLAVAAHVHADSLSFDGLRGSFPTLPLEGAVAGLIEVRGTALALDTRVELSSAAGAVAGQGVLTLTSSRVGVRDLTLSGHDVNLAHWVRRAPVSRLTAAVQGTWEEDSGVPPLGALAATVKASVVAGAPIDSGRAVLRLADGRVYVDSLRVLQPGLVTTAGGALGWRRPVTGVLSADFDADSLNALDSLLGWLVGPDVAAATGGPRSLRGSARVALAIEGALDSLAFDARATIEQVVWRGVGVPSARGHVIYEPGPVPAFRIDATVDSLALGDYGLGDAVVAAQGTTDSLTWFARTHVGAIAAVSAAGRVARARAVDPPDDRGARIELDVDSLSILVPGGVWQSLAPVRATASDSGFWVGPMILAPQGDSTRGVIAVQGAAPTRGSLAANVRLAGLPLAGVYALLDQDTAGVGGTVAAALALGGTRAEPVYLGSLSLVNGSLGEFRMPYVDATFSYAQRRLDAEVHLWRAGDQILNVTAGLPLDLALQPAGQRELPDRLSIRARADSVDLSLLEALTPLLQEVRGVVSADVGVDGTWAEPRLRGTMRIARAASIPALNVRYENVVGDLALSGDTIEVRALSAQSDRGRVDVSGFVRLEELLHPELALHIKADRFKALDLRNRVTVTGSGELALTGPVIGATLSGRATVTSGALYFADLVDKRIVDLSALTDTSLAAVIQQQKLGPAFESVFLDSLRVQDLDLDMGSGVWLRSNEANIQLTGRVSLTKQGAG